jgi:two-component system CheB/CheR fusion protein
MSMIGHARRPAQASLDMTQAQARTDITRAASEPGDHEPRLDDRGACMAHDIMNALSVMGLQSRRLGERLARLQLHGEKRFADTLADSAGFVSALMRELVGLTRQEPTGPGPSPERLMLGDLVKAVLGRATFTAEGERLRLTVEGEPVVSGQAGQIERVLRNLVQNAVEHSPAGSAIDVRVGVRGALALVTVSDRGAGLTGQEASYVFEKHRRSPAGRTPGGQGLGLYICRQIIEAHHGRIGVISRPGTGSRFFFLLPLDRSEPAKGWGRAGPSGPRAATGPPSGLRVLLADDDPEAISALLALLGDRELDVSGATHAGQALALAAAHPPDVAVLDLEMPDTDGLTLLRRLRDRQPFLPAVIMSGYGPDDPDIAAACRAPDTAHLGKPFDIERLLGLLGRLWADRAVPVAAMSGGPGTVVGMGPE